MRTIRVKLVRVVDGGICVAASDGQRVHEEIYEIIRNGDRVELSFEGVSRITTAFLNAAVGQLYGEFSETQLRQHLAPPIDADDWHLSRLKLVIDRAKEYFRDAQKVERILKDNEEG